MNTSNNWQVLSDSYHDSLFGGIHIHRHPKSAFKCLCVCMCVRACRGCVCECVCMHMCAYVNV